MPIRSRSRSCHPAQFGGKDCSYLEQQARRTYMVEQNCSHLPECPRPAKFGPWGEWSACSQSCYQEGHPVPQQKRKKTCIPESRSRDSRLNRNLITCKELGEVKAYKNCNIGTCPGKMRLIEIWLFSVSFFSASFLARLGGMGQLHCQLRRRRCSSEAAKFCPWQVWGQC